MNIKRGLVFTVLALALVACGTGAGGASDATSTPAPFVTQTPIPRFQPTTDPNAAQAAPPAPPLPPDGAIQVGGVSLQVAVPRTCKLVEIVNEPNRYGSERAFDYKLNAGFGCPSESGDVRMQEVQFLTLPSLESYAQACNSVGGCDSSRVTPEDFAAQRDALAAGQPAGPWTLLQVGGRTVLVRSSTLPDAPVVIRRYAEYCGDVRVENWVAIVGANPDTLEGAADAFFASVGLTCLA